jgi:serine/threonine-protein kinase
LLAGRFRIVAPLGKGGMGEVYRAEDLRLGQAVALKFLAPDLANDPQQLANFHEEVKLARQVSHPNVCRVYDIGEADGQPFLAMEYVDGEDLASLLKRIGRLPPDKGVHIAQQLCAGLAAAHERGVIHRDLKPANIMLDGRGHVRVMDFGLARVAEKLEGGDVQAGTRAYMAPEQRAGTEVTARSDLYSLGLVLYELFTGKRPFPAKSLAELARMQEESSPVSPSSLVSDLDPAVERVILRCLEREPFDRPASARAVAAALPGGDPLAAALAAGETPSPDMVAAAPDPSRLSPAVAIACLAGVVVGLVIACLLAQRAMLINRAPMELPPDALEVEAKRIIQRLGYVELPAQTARGFEEAPSDLQFVMYADLPEGGQDRWDLLKTGHWPGIRFWYRQSPQPMFVTEYVDEQTAPSRTRVTPQIPPWTVAGMVGVRLDPRGKLRWFRAVPPHHPRQTRLTPSPPSLPGKGAGGLGEQDLPWSMWFREEDITFKLSSDSESVANPKRLSAEELRTADWLWTPPDAYDSLAAWSGTWPGSDERPLVEAAAYRGRPVYFAILPPSLTGAGTGGEGGGLPAVQIVLFWLFFGLFVGAVLLAWRNLRLGRGDRRGALRLAFFV